MPIHENDPRQDFCFIDRQLQLATFLVEATWYLLGAGMLLTGEAPSTNDGPCSLSAARATGRSLLLTLVAVDREGEQFIVGGAKRRPKMTIPRAPVD